VISLRNKCQIFIYALALVLISIFIIIPAAFGKTLTNKDIERIRGRQNRNVPDYRTRPEIPPVPGGSRKGALVVKKFLPYRDWQEEYRDYFKRHYKNSNLRLEPRMIILHYSRVPTFAKLWWTFFRGGKYFAGNQGKKFGHLSTHFVIDRDGSIYQLMPLDRKARGTYGVNHVAVSIEIIGRNEKELLANKKQMKVAFALVKWLMRKFRIQSSGVRAHTEVARGKELVPEYTDYVDKKYPDRYPPNSRPRGPGKKYMFKLRYYLHEPR